MVELKGDRLLFSFPEVHEFAKLEVTFLRTVRVPDNDRKYPLPPGLGCFPLRHVDDFADSVPQTWLTHGGVMLPMHQSEAMWLYFSAHRDWQRGTGYPFAVLVATGKINAVTGDEWEPVLRQNQQNYLALPDQLWLDGYCVEKGVIRQFVAMPLGAGYTAEEQLTGKAEHGGIQIIVFPMKGKAYDMLCQQKSCDIQVPMFIRRDSIEFDMGLAPGGQIRQQIEEDQYDFSDWNTEHAARCFVHLMNSENWQEITHTPPPIRPLTAKEYSKLGFPWFDLYEEHPAVDASEKLANLKSVAQLSEEKNEVVLPENESCIPEYIVQLRKTMKKNQVREGQF